MKKFVREIQKVSSHSYSVTVPKELIEKYGWRGKQKVEISDKGRGRIEIKDWRKR